MYHFCEQFTSICTVPFRTRNDRSGGQEHYLGQKVPWTARTRVLWWLQQSLVFKPGRPFQSSLICYVCRFLYKAYWDLNFCSDIPISKWVIKINTSSIWIYRWLYANSQLKLKNKLIDMTSLATYVKRFKNVVYNFSSLSSQNGFLISCIIRQSSLDTTKEISLSY